MSAELLLIYVGAVLRQTPWWAYALLALLVWLGVRRLKSRSRRLRVAFAAPLAFAVWSLAGAIAYAKTYGAASSLLVWTPAAAAGATSAFLAPGRAGQPQADGRFLFPATVGPLATYITVFFTRYALEIWAGFAPDQRHTASLLALTLSTVMAGRTSGEVARLMALRRKGFV